jgi:hypothetical protein
VDVAAANVVVNAIKTANAVARKRKQKSKTLKWKKKKNELGLDLVSCS